jgi:hypothetical protein
MPSSLKKKVLVLLTMLLDDEEHKNVKGKCGAGCTKVG